MGKSGKGQLPAQRAVTCAFLVVVTVALVIIGVTILAQPLPATEAASFRLEILKACLQVIGVAVIGGGLTFLAQQYKNELEALAKAKDTLRDLVERRNREQHRILEEIESGYTRCKRIRRTARADRNSSTGGRSFARDKYEAWMKELDEIQSAFETISDGLREAGGAGMVRSLFPDNLVGASLKILEQYLRVVTYEWETHGARRPDEPIACEEVPRFTSFIEDPDSDECKENLIIPFRKARREIHRLLYGSE